MTTSSDRFTHYIRYAKRIIKLLVIWNLIYLPLISYKTMVDGNFSVVKTGALLLIGRLPAFGVAWYLCASVVGLGSLLLMMHFLGNKVTFFISIGIEVFLILLSGYHSILSSFDVFNTGIFKILIYLFIRSWLYFILGFWLSTNVEKVAKISKKLILVLMLALVTEIFLITKFGLSSGGTGPDETFLIPVLSLALAIYSLQANVHIRNAITLRRLSTFIYLAHLGVLKILEIVLIHFFNLNVSVLNWLFTAIIVCVIYYVLSRKESLIKLLV